eukprot:6205630-Pleurochrysis_carterae.AAC.4
MKRINSLPLELQLSRSILRVATLSAVFSKVSISCWSTFASISASEGIVSDVEAVDASAAVVENLGRVRIEAESEAIDRLKAGSSGDGEWGA